MDNIPFTSPQPPKDWNERLEHTKSVLINTSSMATANLSILGGTLKEKGSTAGVVLQEKSSVLKQKLVEKQVGQKIQGMFANLKAKAASATGAGTAKEGEAPQEGEQKPDLM